MCGIAGFTGDPDPETLRRMTRALVHRGPDGEGFHEEPGISLGMRRLAIVDLLEGKQPVCNETGEIRVIQNGEIYNHRELRADLSKRGHVFSTHHSDTEVIVHLYEELSERWAEKANGMFALAVWDRARRRLSLYRDRMGKKPLYYAEKNGRLIFASEIKALLLHPDVSRDLDFSAIYQYFGQKNISAPATAFKGIRQLMPGHVLLWDEKGGRIFCYWKPDFSPRSENVTEQDACEEILRLLTDSVRLRMDCDVPYGAYLSGGVDSSSVAAIMSSLMPRPVSTFCLGYEDKALGRFAGKMEDLKFARDMARRIGALHHEYIFGAKEFAENMPDVIRAMDEPFSGTVSTFFLTKLISRHVKVALSGDGADELFGSYLPHRMAGPVEHLMALACMGKARWEDLDEDDARLLAPFDTREKFAFLSRIAHADMAVWRDRLSVFPVAERKNLLSPAFFEAMGQEGKNIYEGMSKGLTALDPVNKSLEIDQMELLPNQVLVFVDRLSMAHSVEVRCPFLDFRLVSYVNSLPGSFKIRNAVNKYILKKAVGDLLPPDLVNRPKEGFVQPVYSWMRGSLKPFIVERVSELPEGFFNRAYVERLIACLDSDDDTVSARIWNLVCFGIWHSGL